jgi:hypothetical protein
MVARLGMALLLDRRWVDMSTKKKLLEAAAGNAGGEAVYVDDVFSTFLYEGRNNASGLRDINNGIDLAGEGGLVWSRERDNQAEHLLIDTERGLSGGYLATDATSPQNLGRIGESIDSFTSTGYKLDGGGTLWDRGSYKYFSWTFRKQPGFFDIVTYTGNDTNGRTISHNLGSVPGMIIIKSTSHGESWYVYHRGMDSTAPEDYNMHLNTIDARADENQMLYDTAPTSTEFTVAGFDATNGTGKTYVAYLFAHDAQDFGTDSDEAIIKCGSYTGNGSSTAGPTIDLGFEPQFILQRAIDRTANWYIYDSMRGIVTGGDDTALSPNTTTTEYVTERISLTASGFQITTTNGNFNQSGEKYIYMAICRPNKPAEEFEADELFGVNSYSEANDYQQLTTGNLVDLGWQYLNGDGAKFFTRLLGKGYVNPTSNSAANTSADSAFDFMDGFEPHYANSVSGFSPRVVYGFKRAPGFFDVVAYNGDASNPISHNLGVAPELIITKEYAHVWDWYVWGSVLGDNKFINLNLANAATNHTFNTTVTATTFRSGISSSNQPTVAYLFASVDGISKVGSYTGTGNDLNVDCGFSAGARFILIKRTDNNGDWYVYDSVRGIVAGDDPYFLLNSTASQTANTDYIDPLNAGFTVTSSAPAALNNSGGTYIFLAIA